MKVQGLGWDWNLELSQGIWHRKRCRLGALSSFGRICLRMKGRIQELQPWSPAHRFLSSLYRLLLVISSSGLMSLDHP